MNRIVLLAVAVVLVLLPSSARADHGVESVHGGLRLETITTDPGSTITGHLAVSARDASSGAQGSVEFFQRRVFTGGFTFVAQFEGEVDCLQVTGSAAVLSGDITRSSGLEGFNEKFQVTVVDGGNPEAGMTTDSAVVEATGAGPTDPTTCAVGAGGQTFFLSNPTSARGNIVVHDDV